MKKTIETETETTEKTAQQQLAQQLTELLRGMGGSAALVGLKAAVAAALGAKKVLDRAAVAALKD